MRVTQRPSSLRRCKHGVITSLLLVVGCTQAPVDQVRIPSDPKLPTLEWETALSDDVVEVFLIDRRSFYHVDRIDLRGPNNQNYEATDITRRVFKDRGYHTGARVGVGAGSGGGGVRTGIGLSFPLGNRTSRNHIKTEAGIALPDPGFYRATANQWTIRVTLTDQVGEQSTADIPAPGG